MDCILALHPAAPGLIPGIPKNFSEFFMLPRLINGASAYSSGQQRLNISNWSSPSSTQASGKLVLQKSKIKKKTIVTKWLAIVPATMASTFCKLARSGQPLSEFFFISWMPNSCKTIEQQFLLKSSLVQNFGWPWRQGQGDVSNFWLNKHEFRQTLFSHPLLYKTRPRHSPFPWCMPSCQFLPILRREMK